jgi:hypothetical protein
MLEMTIQGRLGGASVWAMTSRAGEIPRGSLGRLPEPFSGGRGGPWLQAVSREPWKLPQQTARI